MKKLLLFSIVFLSACTASQKDGSLQMAWAPPLAEQHWTIADAPKGKQNFCTISAGELNVLQRREGALQVGVTRSMPPGGEYKVLIGSHVYSTHSAVFSPKQSRAIVKDLKTADTVYTQWRQQDGSSLGRDWHWVNNKIPLKEFSARYNECAQRLSGKS